MPGTGEQTPNGHVRISGGTPAWAVLLILAGLVLVGCGQPGALSAASLTGAAARAARAPATGVDQPTALAAWWNLTSVQRAGDGVFTAVMQPASPRPARAPVHLQMTGIGFPSMVAQGGHRFTGPGVDLPWDGQNNTYQVTLRFSGVRLGLLVYSTGGDWRTLVNGAVVGGSPPQSAGSGSAYHVLDLDFAKDGGARQRTITFQLSGGAWLSGVATGAATDVISAPPSTPADAPSVYWLGDSYVVGAGSLHPGFDDLVHVADQRLGLVNVTVDALGGTGYRKVNAAAKFPSYLTRARRNLQPGRAVPDLIVVGGSINDAGYTSAELRASASALFTYLARAEPRAKVVVIPFTAAYPVPLPTATAIGGVLSAARSARNVIGVLDLPARVLAQRGQTPVASLSAQLSSTTLAGHPSPAAHALYGRLIAGFLARLISQHGLRAR